MSALGETPEIQICKKKKQTKWVGKDQKFTFSFVRLLVPVAVVDVHHSEFLRRPEEGFDRLFTGHGAAGYHGTMDIHNHDHTIRSTKQNL